MCKHTSSSIVPIRQVEPVPCNLYVTQYVLYQSRLFEIAVRHLDLDSLLEFFEQIRLLTESPLTKRSSELSPLSHHSLFPMPIVIERIGDMTLGNEIMFQHSQHIDFIVISSGIIASLRPRYHVCRVWSCVSQMFIQVHHR
jgi:hypothetical protein